MNPARQAWAAFLISSALIIATLWPVIYYLGFLFIYFPAFLFFGCDNARGAGDCLRIQLMPFVPIVLTLVALIACRIAVNKGRYFASVLVAAAACAASWLAVKFGFG